MFWEYCFKGFICWDLALKGAFLGTYGEGLTDNDNDNHLFESTYKAKGYFSKNN